MKSLNLGRYVLASCMAAALLAGCGGSQPPLGAAGVMVHSRTIATHAARGKSWMLPEMTGEPDQATNDATVLGSSRIMSGAKSNKLLYVAGWPNYPNGTAYVYTYPQGKLVATFTLLGLPFGACSDSSGHVFILIYKSSSSTIYEYAHGGTTPIATLSYPGLAQGCNVNATTGDLAVSGAELGYGGTLAIYPNATGQPKLYYTKTYDRLLACAYDSKGKLYIVAWNGYWADQAQLLRLSDDSSSFEVINLKPIIYFAEPLWPSVQWDGKHIAVTSGKFRQAMIVYRLSILGTAATVVGSTTLTSKKDRFTGGTWIQNNTIVGTGYDQHCYEDAFVWSYPGGAMPKRTINRLGGLPCPQIAAATVSLAPPQ